MDELREKHELGTIARIELEAKEYRRLTAIAKEHGNAANRQKTQIKNAVKRYARAEEMSPDDYLIVDDEEYRYDVTTTDKISIDKFWDLFDKKKITIEQLKEVVSINKGDAERVIGAHVINSITETVKGKTADIRTQPAKTAIKGIRLVRKQPEATEVEAPKVQPIAANATPKRAGKVVVKRRILKR